ncbi:mitochondrial transcription rescue factor 1 [Prorops nasuta]|uniref:mitochondrial transcription rescue factor 1 n=1 Tax=Prorops nasuta TaxID=863751 RepID=UPI0034CFC763
MSYVFKSDTNFKLCNNNILYSSNLLQNQLNDLIIKRYKSKKKKQREDYKHESDDDDENNVDESDTNEAIQNAKDLGSTIVTVKANNLRLDVVTKSALGLKRSKIEDIFYENLIRLNGEMPAKKSVEVNMNDEIDVILDRELENPNLIRVNRIVLLNVEPTHGGLSLTLSRDKNLLIEDYAKK